MTTRALSLTLALPLALGLAGTGALAQTFVPGQQFLTMWDRNGDGAVTLPEARERRDEIFTTFDANADGILSPDELAALDDARTDMRAQMQEARSEAGMGKGMGKDMGMGMGHGKGAGVGGGGAALRDANGDGQVTREEFVGLTTAFFARMDRNGDGSLTTGDFGRR
ncbi:calcium-binding protein [Pseudogemmobacter blasticus]|uniref:Calcium-binding protein n=1 Tax=Fuscovulum blasticum DSM 2131 TaxID=1188250 RepID=A0A2T4JCW3_FUSBL|nr:calcium-binding protein [Fuscovulum blasticum]PTE15752.1 calcium-binding protein [Fuscovulum blasticum DSM 2131]